MLAPNAANVLLSRREFVSLAAATATVPSLAEAQPAPPNAAAGGIGAPVTAFMSAALSAFATRRSALAFRCWSRRRRAELAHQQLADRGIQRDGRVQDRLP